MAASPAQANSLTDSGSTRVMARRSLPAVRPNTVRSGRRMAARLGPPPDRALQPADLGTSCSIRQTTTGSAPAERSGDGLFKSEDGCLTWARCRLGSAGECHPGGRGFLFSPTSTAFLLSEDNTETWTNIMNSRLPTTRTQSVFRSLDGGRPLAGHQQWPDVAQHGPKRSGNHRSYESADPLGGERRRRHLQEPRWRRPLVRGELRARQPGCAVYWLAMDPDNSSVLYALAALLAKRLLTFPFSSPTIEGTRRINGGHQAAKAGFGLRGAFCRG